MKRSNKKLLGIVLCSVVVLAMLGVSVANAAYAPMYYKPIYINNTGGSELTYYPVVLNVTYSTGMTIDFDDLRVKYYDGDEWVFVPYWIEKKVNNEWCKLWFNATYISANSWCNDSYRLYYGDNLANSESDFDSVFIREIDGGQHLNGSWHFDEGEGTTAYDSSGKGNDGTIYGASWTDGKFGEALDFDGDYVDCGSDESLRISDEITVATWIKPYSMSGLKVIVTKQYSFELDRSGSNKINFYIGDGSWWQDHVTTTSSYTLQKWTYVVGVYDGSNLKIYIDGSLDNSKSTSVTFGTNSKHVYIGNGIGSYYFHGMIDEVHIYDRALSADEISDLYNYYGYTTSNYPGRVLVRKRIDPEPTTSLGSTQIIDPSDAVVTLAPANVKSNSLTMQGYLNYAPADVWIEWGTEHGGHVFKTSSKHMDDLGWITFDVTSPILFANKKYKYRAVAVIEGTTYYGEDYVFTMGDADVPDIVQNNTFSESYNMINYTNLTTEAFALAIINVWTSVWGSFFWVLICGFPFVLMYITQHNTTIPGVLAMILGGTMLIYLPPEWQSVAYSLLIVAVAGIMVGIFKSKR